MSATSLYSLLDLSTETAENLGATDDISISTCKRLINRALVRITEKYDWPFLFVEGGTIATVGGTETYSLSATVQKVTNVYVTGTRARTLRLMENRQFRQTFTNPILSTGTPNYYRYAGVDSVTGAKKIGLYTIPSTVETIYYDYIKKMPLLSNHTDDVRIVCGLPDHTVDALIELATAIGMRKFDDADYESAMAEAIVRWDTIYQDYTNEIDDRLRARAFEGADYDGPMPVLPPQFGPQ